MERKISLVNRAFVRRFRTARLERNVVLVVEEAALVRVSSDVFAPGFSPRVFAARLHACLILNAITGK